MIASPLSFSAQTNDDRRAGQARGDCGRHMLGHFKPDYVSGRPILLLDRDSAGSLPLSRATSQALRFNSARLGFLNFLDSRKRLGWQAFAYVNKHQIRLSCSASSSAERKARKAFHDHGEVTHVLGQIIRGEND